MHMRIDKHNARSILAGVVVILFFVVVAGFLDPGTDTGAIENEDTRVLAESRAWMVWWMTIAVIILLVMLVLIVTAA
jgi:hypothetical protein